MQIKSDITESCQLKWVQMCLIFHLSRESLHANFMKKGILGPEVFFFRQQHEYTVKCVGRMRHYQCVYQRIFCRRTPTVSCCAVRQCERQQGCRQTSHVRCVRVPVKAVIKECRETAVTSKMTLRVCLVE